MLTQKELQAKILFKLGPWMFLLGIVAKDQLFQTIRLRHPFQEHMLLQMTMRLVEVALTPNTFSTMVSSRFNSYSKEEAPEVEVPGEGERARKAEG